MLQADPLAPDPAYQPGMQRQQSTGALLSQARDIADRALAAFIIIQAAIKRSSCLKGFCCREDLNARMPNYQVGTGRRGCMRLAMARHLTGNMLACVQQSWPTDSLLLGGLITCGRCRTSMMQAPCSPGEPASPWLLSCIKLTADSAACLS